MTEHSTPTSPRRHGRALDELAERWARLTPDRRPLAALALDAIAAGEFTSSHSWNRFVQSVDALLAELDRRDLSAEQLHRLALEAARMADPPADPAPGTPRH